MFLSNFKAMCLCVASSALLRPDKRAENTF